jgi:hypothetical protein
MQQRPYSLLVLGYGLLGASVAAASMGELSFQAVGILGPAYQHKLPGDRAAAASTGRQEFWGLLAKCWLPGATGAVAVMGEQSLWAAGALEPACQYRLT